MVDMSGSHLQSARAVAAEVLRQFDPQRARAGPVLNRLLNRTDERQRATDLVFGTIRNLRAIDTVIAAFSGRRIERISKILLAVIRVGIYELVYTPDSPPYSIVNEAVNTVKRMGGRKQTGFVNAVLRQVVRHIAERQTELAQANAMRTMIQNRESGCAFDTDFLPNPQTDLASHLSVSFSLPRWLLEAWLNDFGPEQTREICFGSNRRPSVYVRVNLLRTTPAALLERLTNAGVGAEPVPCDFGFRISDFGLAQRCQSAIRNPQSEMVKIVGPQSVAQLPGFAQGLFTVQDVSASNAVRLLDPQPQWNILDSCAAPGTKTMQLAEMTQDAAQIVATDINAKRLTKLDENLARFGLKSVTVVPYPELGRKAAGPFDAVLLDVPCSNTGVLARRIEVRFRITPASVKELAKTQRGLLERAASLLKPGGRICYSTCSIQRAENGDLVRAFLEANRQFELMREQFILPSSAGFDRDGAYAAVLMKSL